MRVKIRLFAVLCTTLLMINFITIRTVVYAESTDSPSIQTIWINSMKMSVSNFGEKKATELEQEINLIMNQKNEICGDIKTPNLYWTICIKYEDGKTNVFRFFYTNKQWYMKITDETCYCNANIAGKYFSAATSNLSIMPNNMDFSEKDIIVDEEIEKNFREHDLIWYYVMERKKMHIMGISDNIASNKVQSEIQNAIMLYNYAINHGYTCSDLEVQIRIYTMLIKMKMLDKTDSFYNIFEKKAGISYVEYLQKDIFKLRYEILYEKMYNSKYDEFRCGNDQINGVECNNLSEYWNNFLTEIVYNNWDDYNMKTINQIISAGEVYYSNLGC